MGLAALAAYGGGRDSFDDVGEFMLIGAVAVVAGGLYSFATLDDSARERGIALAPVFQTDGGAGLALSVRL